MQKNIISERLTFREQASNLIRAFSQPQEKTFQDILVVRTAGKIVLIRLDEIHWVESARNSVRIHSHTEIYSIRGSLEKLEGMLTQRFVRINRSTIVNLYEVQELQTWFHGNLRVSLRDKSVHLLSPSYKKRFFEILGNPFG